MRRASVKRVLYQYFPAVACLLERIQVEGNKIIEKEALYLSTENIDFGSEDIERVTVSSRWTRTSWGCPRPLFSCFERVSRVRCVCCELCLQVFRRYKVSSSMSLSSVFVSPPKTINALPTSKLACPTLGPGPSEVVATG